MLFFKCFCPTLACTTPGAAAAGAGGGKNAGGGGKSSEGSIIFLVTIAGRETQLQVDNNGEDDQAEDANGRSLGVDGDRGSVFISKANFISEASSEGEQMMERAQRKECVKALA